MKKFVVFICMFFMLSLNTFALTSKSSILIEYSTGEILVDNNSLEKGAPASMTKIMTLLLIMEKIDSGKIKLTDKVTISANAASMGGSQVFLQPNEQITVEELIKSICIASANDAAVAMAEYVAGSEEKFVKLMNEKSKELGLKNSNFANVHGLDNENHYSCPYDMSLIAQALLKYDSILKYTSTYEDYLKKNDGSSIWLVNTNKLIKYYTGLDGLKTGYTGNAGYCLTATALRNGMRLISVVMGSETSEGRSNDTIELLDYGFNTYKLNTIFNKDINLGSIKIINGKKDEVKLKLLSDVVDLNSIDDDFKYDYKLNVKDIEAPVNVGDIVGKLDLYRDGKKIKSYDITVKESVKKANLWDYYKKNFKYLITGNI